MVDQPRIAMVGVGNVGGALGTTFARAGFPVTFGTRGGDVSKLLEAAGAGAKAASPVEAVQGASVVFLAVPGSKAVEAAVGLAEHLAGKVVVDCNNPLRWDAGPVWDPPAEGSIAAAIQRAIPAARVVKAFNGFGAELHADPRIQGKPVTTFLAGDDAGAKSMVSEIATRAGFAPVDAGPLRNAAVLENVAMLWIHLALAAGHGREVAFQLVRRDGA
jgi:predicted dinucleotide-binding enzyme